MASIIADSESSGTVNLFGAINKSGCSAQYCEYSTSEVGDKMNGGAVNEDKSPLNDAIDLRKDVHECELEAVELEAEAVDDIEAGEPGLASDDIFEEGDIKINNL